MVRVSLVKVWDISHNRMVALSMRRFLFTATVIAVTVVLVLATARAAQAADRIHVVAPGEGLARIAQQYNLSMAQLAAYNGISNPDRVLIGQQLAIPYDGNTVLAAPPATSDILPGEAGYHMVVPGDMLSQIAKSYGMTLPDLMRLNGLSDADSIYVGQKLRVSARVEALGETSPVEPTLADTIYVVAAGETLATIAQGTGMTVNDLMLLNGLPNPNFVWTGQRLRVKQPPTPAEAMAAAGAPADGLRRIEINLTDQTLTAWQGDVAILHTYVSTGKASTPTIPGTFAIYDKIESQRMTGDDYDLPGVPWVMYYYRDYAIHGAYWHANFGTPTSHGCTNMTPEEAAALYQWADVGTEVLVHY
ncbi:MAG: LysM peptidoglycan-binding domain-containing protein [Caldilineaceae bacterium]